MLVRKYYFYLFILQACHNKVPNEIVFPCVKTLAYNFVTDRSSPEVISNNISI